MIENLHPFSMLPSMPTAYSNALSWYEAIAATYSKANEVVELINQYESKETARNTKELERLEAEAIRLVNAAAMSAAEAARIANETERQGAEAVRQAAYDTIMNVLNLKAAAADLSLGRVYKGVVSASTGLPASASAGDFYYCTADAHYYMWNGTAWTDIGTGDTAYTQMEEALESSGIYKYTQQGLTNIDGKGFSVTNNAVTQTDSTYMKSIELPVTPGDVYRVKTTIGNSWKGIILANGTAALSIPLIGGTSWATTTMLVRIPAGVNRMYVNCNSTYGIYIHKRGIQSIAFSTKYKYAVPGHYETHLAEKIASIQAKEEAYGFNGCSFQLVTDMHTDNNYLSSLPMMERVRDKTNADMLINNGDSVLSLGSSASIKEQLHRTMDYLYSIFGRRIKYVLGNHDFMISNSTSWDSAFFEYVDKSAVYAIVDEKFDCSSRDKLYHYYDDSSGIRHVFLDYTDLNKSAQFDWLISTLSDDTKHYCIYCHIPVVNADGSPNASEITQAALLHAILKALKGRSSYSSSVVFSDTTKTVSVNFAGRTSELVAVFSGHVHKDTITTKDGVRYVTSDCDARYNDNGTVTRSAGTVTENAFDVVCINMGTKTVDLIRLGAGSNRQFTY